MMDSWWKVWSKAQKWYEPVGLCPIRSAPSGSRSTHFPLALLSPEFLYHLPMSSHPWTFCGEGIKGHWA